MKKPYLLIFFVLSFLLWSLVNLTEAQQISGNQIRNGAISWKHLADSLRGTSGYTGAIAFLSATGHVAYAETSAVAANGSVKTTAAFSSALRDSLRFYYIDSTNTARLALTVVDGAIDDTANFSQGVRDGLFGRNATKWIYYVQNALRADTATYATRSATSALADSALNVVSPDTVPYADVAGYAKFAGYADEATHALTADAIGIDTADVQWVDLDATTQDSILIAYLIKIGTTAAKRADSLNASAIDDYGMFSSGMKSAYIPTTGEKSGFTGVTTLGGAQISATNKIVDSTLFDGWGVKKTKTAVTGMGDNKNINTRIGFAGNYAPSVNYTMAIDTGTLNRVTIKTATETLILRDSTQIAASTAAITSATASNFYDYGGAGSATHNISLSNGTPSGAADVGDIKLDTALTGDLFRGYVYSGTGASASVWLRQDTSGSGGGGTPNQVSTTVVTSPVSTDSLIYRNANNQSFSADTAFISPHYAKFDTVFSISHQTGGFGSHARKFSFGWWNKLQTDTLAGGGSNHSIDTLNIFAGKIAFLGTTDLGTTSSPVSIITYDGGLTYVGVSQVTNSSTGGQINYTDVGNIFPDANATYDLGSHVNGLAWDSVYTDDVLALTAVRAGSGVSYTKMDAGNFTATGVTTTGTLNSTGNVTTSTGDFVGNKNFIYNGATPRYTISENQWYAMDDACSPNDSNEIMTRSAVTRGYKNAMDFAINADSVKRALPYYWRSFWAFMARNVPECQSRDSLGLTNDADFANIGSTELSPAYIDNPTIVPVPEDTTFDQNTYTLPRFVGIIEADTATRRTGKMLIRDWDNPLARGEYVVCDNGSDSIGMFTGYFKTIQAALNNIPNLRIRPISSDLSSGYGRYLLSPVSSATYNGLVRYGSTVIDTISGGGKRDSVLLNYFVKTGSWFCIDSIVSNAYEDTNARKKIWASIDYDILGAVNARQLTFADTQAFKEQDDKVYLTIARPWTITVWPNAQRAVRVITAPIDIPNYAPVTIKGVGEDETIISNMASGYLGTAPSFSSIFRHKNNTTVAAQDTIAGLPITIKNMTIVGAAGSTTSDSSFLTLSGKVKLENLTIIASGNANANRVIDYKGFSMNRPTQYFGYKQNSLYCENVTVAADTDRIVFNLRSPVSLQSRNSTYGIAGNSSRILVATDTLGTNPQFSQDEFFINIADGWTTPTYTMEATTAQSTLKLSTWGCHYIGKAETFDGVNWTGNSYSSPYNVYEAGYNDAPVKLTDRQKRFQVKRISPK